MTCLKSTLLFFVVISVVYGYVVQFPPSKSTNSSYPDHCYDPQVEAYYKPRGEPYIRKGRCETISCRADFSMTAYG